MEARSAAGLTLCLWWQGLGSFMGRADEGIAQGEGSQKLTHKEWLCVCRMHALALLRLCHCLALALGSSVFCEHSS